MLPHNSHQRCEDGSHLHRQLWGAALLNPNAAKRHSLNQTDYGALLFLFVFLPFAVAVAFILPLALTLSFEVAPALALDLDLALALAAFAAALPSGFCGAPGRTPARRQCLSRPGNPPRVQHARARSRIRVA